MGVGAGLGVEILVETVARVAFGVAEGEQAVSKKTMASERTRINRMRAPVGWVWVEAGRKIRTVLRLNPPNRSIALLLRERGSLAAGIGGILVRARLAAASGSAEPRIDSPIWQRVRFPGAVWPVVA